MTNSPNCFASNSGWMVKGYLRKRRERKLQEYRSCTAPFSQDILFWPSTGSRAKATDISTTATHSSACALKFTIRNMV